MALPSIPTHLLKAFLHLVYLGSAQLDEQDISSFLSLLKLLNVEGVVEEEEGVSRGSERVRTGLIQDLSSPKKGLVGSDLVADKFAKVGLEIPKGIVFKEEKAEVGNCSKIVDSNFKHKVIIKEEAHVNGEEEQYFDENDKRPIFDEIKSLNKIKEGLKKKRGPKPRSRLYVCNQCDFSTDVTKVFKNHNLYKHQEREALCDQCDKRFFTNEHLRNHIKAVHELATFSCSSCSFKGGTKRRLVMHVQRNHAEKHLLCDECSYVCSDAGFLRIHVGRHHTDKSLWPKCDWPGCDYTSWPEKNVKNHYKKVHEGIRYKCNICSKIFTARANMHAHKLKIHRDLLKSDNRAKTTTRASFDSRYTFLEDDAKQEEEETPNTKPQEEEETLTLQNGSGHGLDNI